MWTGKLASSPIVSSCFLFPARLRATSSELPGKLCIIYELVKKKLIEGSAETHSAQLLSMTRGHSPITMRTELSFRMSVCK